MANIRKEAQSIVASGKGCMNVLEDIVVVEWWMNYHGGYCTWVFFPYSFIDQKLPTLDPNKMSRKK